MIQDVGYKRPPKHTQFKKGVSGNPKGRAKGQRNLKTDLLAELAETVRITEGGAQRSITKQRALLKALTARAIGGDIRAANVVLTLVQQLLTEDPSTQTASQPLSASDQAIIDSFLASAPAKGGQGHV